MTSTPTVRITVRGQLSDRLATAFDGMALERRPGATALVGVVADEAQLHALLARVRDLGLELESVRVMRDEQHSNCGRTEGGRHVSRSRQSTRHH